MWKSDHKYGSSMIKDDHYYVHIPKCASSWAKKYFRAMSWRDSNFNDFDTHNKQGIVILRDPMERWLSHKPMRDMITHGISKDLIDAFVARLPNIVLDEHTAPQSEFIKGLDHNSLKFFKCNSELVQQFNYYFKQDIEIEKQNVSEKDSVYTNNWLTLMQDQRVKDCWEKIYQRDIELFESKC